MNNSRASLSACLLTITLGLALAAPGAADSGISVSAGPAFLLGASDTQIGGQIQSDIGLGYDLGPKAIVPIRVSLDLNYAGGSNDLGSLSTYGLGAGARLTTPAYVGASVSLVDVNVHPSSAAFPAGIIGGQEPAASSTVGVGESFFVGQRLFGIPGGGGLALQATYRHMPSSGGYDPSNITLGLRASF
jgi:hypothetical protein